jgi:hypothetical protein
MNKLALPLALVLVSCAAHTSAGGPAGHVAARACGPAARVPEQLLAAPSVLLFGEVHGTTELPALFGELVCQVSASRPVMVGLEVHGSERTRVTTFLDSSGGASDRAALLAGPFWTSRYQDGRRSEAMFGLLERLRVLRRAGAAVEVALFDVEEPEYGPDRDERMARNLIDAIAAHRGDTVMAYMGNLHARTAVGAPWNPEARFLGWYLRGAGVTFKSFDYASPAGTAWVCMMKEGSDREQVCGPGSWGESRPPPVGTGITLFPEPSPKGFDGIFSVTKLTASPPAKDGR